jgi:hypothetical protein
MITYWKEATVRILVQRLPGWAAKKKKATRHLCQGSRSLERTSNRGSHEQEVPSRQITCCLRSESLTAWPADFAHILNWRGRDGGKIQNAGFFTRWVGEALLSQASFYVLWRCRLQYLTECNAFVFSLEIFPQTLDVHLPSPSMLLGWSS